MYFDENIQIKEQLEKNKSVIDDYFREMQILKSEIKNLQSQIFPKNIGY
jgi:cell division protein FtsB